MIFDIIQKVAMASRHCVYSVFDPRISFGIEKIHDEQLCSFSQTLAACIWAQPLLAVTRHKEETDHRKRVRYRDRIYIPNLHSILVRSTY